MNVAVPKIRPLDLLTSEQLIAAGSDDRGVYIDAAPGSGKTTVSAYRYGMLAFAPYRSGLARGVLATSFTRAATAELRRRVLRFWGPAALAWPNQVVTIDTLVSDCVTHLLEEGMLTWPSGRKRLQVHDSWKVVAPTTRTFGRPRLHVDSARRVIPHVQKLPDPTYTIDGVTYVEMINQGITTHEDVRGVLGQVIGESDVRETIARRLGQRFRALIVDEVFDANAMDLALVELAAAAGADVTIVGDPWQAVYDFRGARSSLIKPFVAKLGLAELPLTRSFRWESEGQRDLASALRARRGVRLPLAQDPRDLDMVLATEWGPLWELGPAVLPLAFGSRTSTPEEAAATLALNRMTELAFGRQATFIGDALITLRLAENALTTMERHLDEVLAILDSPTAKAADHAWDRLSTIVGTVTSKPLRPPHWQYVKRMKQLAARRSQLGAGLVPATTAHQAKGGEWPIVGVHLSDTEQQHLENGLDKDNEFDRKIYVACTRAKRATYYVANVVVPTGKAVQRRKAPRPEPGRSPRRTRDR